VTLVKRLRRIRLTVDCRRHLESCAVTLDCNYIMGWEVEPTSKLPPTSAARKPITWERAADKIDEIQP